MSIITEENGLKHQRGEFGVDIDENPKTITNNDLKYEKIEKLIEYINGLFIGESSKRTYSIK